MSAGAYHNGQLSTGVPHAQGPAWWRGSRCTAPGLDQGVTGAIVDAIRVDRRCYSGRRRGRRAPNITGHGRGCRPQKVCSERGPPGRVGASEFDWGIGWGDDMVKRSMRAANDRRRGPTARRRELPRP
ncbi:hypothetical protein THAOC_08238 [Thalassiosira oceanica]|uniref:Uncharacterized protein n=1 Tax=Thalassiosira oceanica TaxID=159749 RepID=K0TAF6_THAOC|nr:hypothetical protein THAOC_08238 [Thalassiosira oceanica]|eukprot:EJK70406.1 hypothetical protein THAOC_08238 [Thalassiosira oceanica]